jgi:hypothetical protein
LKSIILCVKLLFQTVVLFLSSFHSAVIDVPVKRDISPHRNNTKRLGSSLTLCTCSSEEPASDTVLTCNVQTLLTSEGSDILTALVMKRMYNILAYKAVSQLPAIFILLSFFAYLES